MTTIPNEILLKEIGNILSGGQDVELLTKGNSMNPFIRGEIDSVILRKMPLGNLRAGDIVLARISNDTYVLHRVIHIDGDRITLMGDGNVSGQEHCTTNDILGTVTDIVRPDGRQHKPGRAVIWRKFGYLPRRVLLAFYRRIILRNK